VRNVETVADGCLRINKGSLSAVVTDYLSDPGLRGIPCYTLLHRTEVLAFNCGLGVAKYRHWLSAMKKKSLASAQKALCCRLSST